MARRDLARTAIEGGRAKGSRYAEHRRTRCERAQERVRLARACLDRDYREDVFVEDRRAFAPWEEREFADKLNPVKRWLAARVGRPWSKVYGELKRAFDTRTTPGRHVVEHVLAWVNARGEERRRLYDFELDRRGILRARVSR